MLGPASCCRGTVGGTPTRTHISEHEANGTWSRFPTWEPRRYCHCVPFSGLDWHRSDVQAVMDLTFEVRAEGVWGAIEKLASEYMQVFVLGKFGEYRWAAQAFVFQENFLEIMEYLYLDN